MVIYKCNCGDELIVKENTEQSRYGKKAWKNKHDKEKGHHWTRNIIKRKKT